MIELKKPTHLQVNYWHLWIDNWVRKYQHNNQGVIIVVHLELLREGYLDAAVHVMVHVGQRYNSRLVYDPSYPEIDHIFFMKCDWLEFYRKAKEDIPMNAPEPWGKVLDIQMFESCRSRCGFLICEHHSSVVVLSLEYRHQFLALSLPQ